MLGTGGVAIFWDYENCSVPCNVSGFSIVNQIREVVQQFGGIKLFKAYADLSILSSSHSLALRSELQCSGVSLVDCPHNGRKNVADQTIIVDMLTYAMDHSTFDVILLISGDRDFAYAISTLRFRMYKVVVMAPSIPVAHISLRAQASIFIDWNSAVLNVLKDERLQYEGPSMHNRENEDSIVKPLVQLSTPHEGNTLTKPPDKAPFVDADCRISPLLPLPSLPPLLSPPIPEEEGVCEETSCQRDIAPASTSALPARGFLVNPSSPDELHDPVTVKSPSHVHPHSAPPDTPEIGPPYFGTAHLPSAVK